MRGIRIPRQAAIARTMIQDGPAEGIQLGRANLLVHAGPEAAGGRPRPPQVLRRLHDGERSPPTGRTDALELRQLEHARHGASAGVPTTALALSLRDIGELPHVVQGLRYLEAHRQSETGALALSLACICLAVCDRPHATAREALMTEWRHARYLDNLHVTALALYAATAEQHRCDCNQLPTTFIPRRSELLLLPYSIAHVLSSIVMMWPLRVVLRWSMIAASVVDLPEPVGPVTSVSPVESSTVLRIADGRWRPSRVGISDGMKRKAAAMPRAWW
jgi:hypothetical protein